MNQLTTKPIGMTQQEFNEAVGNAYLDGMRAASRLTDQLADALMLTKQWALGGHGKAPLATINAALAAYEKRNTLS